MDIINKNSEILLIYDAMLCNPNGDPDEENKPRLDPVTMRNLVTDVRLKRFFRDYIIRKYGEEYIWVTKIESKHVDAGGRLSILRNDGEGEPKQIVLQKCIDARLFGATIPIKGKKEENKETKGESISITGPVQFSWGFSLHPVELVESTSITSIFRGRDIKSEETAYGTIGKDYRLYYSLLAFYGAVSGNRANESNLRCIDVEILDHLLYRALKLETTTRSKIGENPLLYMRIEYINADTLIGDLRRFISVTTKESIRSLADVKIDMTELVNRIKANEDNINSVYYWADDQFAEFLNPVIEVLHEKKKRIPYRSDEELDLPKNLLSKITS